MQRPPWGTFKWIGPGLEWLFIISGERFEDLPHSNAAARAGGRAERERISRRSERLPRGRADVMPGQAALYWRFESANRRGPVETKDTVRAVLDRLPDDCSLEDVLYHLYVVQTVARGRADVEAGRTLSQEQVAEELRRKWLVAAEK
jgi:hypothetical protein